MTRVTRFCRFGLVGLLGAALQLLLLWSAMNGGGISAVAATPLVVEFVILHNFLWHERFTWGDRRPIGRAGRLGRLLRFHAGNGLVSLTGNTLFTYLLVERLKAPAVSSAAASIALCSLINFAIADRWVYVVL